MAFVPLGLDYRVSLGKIEKLFTLTVPCAAETEGNREKFGKAMSWGFIE